jgi:hypothetical protein
MTHSAYSAQRAKQYPAAVDSIPAGVSIHSPDLNVPTRGNRKPRRAPNLDLSRLIAPAGKRRPKLIAGILDGLHYGLIQRRGGLYAALARDVCIAAAPRAADAPENRLRRWRSDGAERVTALALQLVAHADAKTGLVGVPRQGRGLAKLTIDEHARRAGLSSSSGERAWKVLRRLGVASAQTFRHKTARGVRAEAPTIFVSLAALAGLAGVAGNFTKQLRRVRHAAADTAERRGMRHLADVLRAGTTAGNDEKARQAAAEVAAERAREAARPMRGGSPPPGGWAALLASITS